MDLGKRLEDVTVIGAAGKMGSGIALLLAIEMTKRKLAAKAPEGAYLLHLVDTGEGALRGLTDYLRVQAVKAAEKSIVSLRPLFADRADLVENGEVIEEFAREVGRRVHLSTDVAAARGSHLVFEAIVENEDIKLAVYRRLREVCGPETYFLTNTSSIPIAVLDDKAGLDGRVLGFHFYNPPPVQKLVELITGPRTRPDLVALARELGKTLRKSIIPANDVAGFIGNGHFSRDGLHALAEVERLRLEGMSFVEAVYAVNRVSQDFLVRPMGIFQLIDYVGVDVFQCILRVMDGYLKVGLHSDLIDALMQKGVKGGQTSSGAQKDGILRYEKGAVAGVYDLDAGRYVDLDRSEAGWCTRVDARLGAPPKGSLPWKKWVARPDRETAIVPYLEAVLAGDSQGSRLARAYLVRSAEIAQALVADGVAASVEDVNGVLTSGFHHAYGPVNPATRRA